MNYRYKYLRFPGGKAKAITLSYDDGCDSDIKMAKTLTSYGLKGTFNLNSFEMRKGGALTPEKVKTLILDNGHEVAVHGAWHRAEGSLRPIEGIKDVLDCRLELENLFGIIIRGMAYPDFGIRKFFNGSSYEMIKNYLSELDISYSRALGEENKNFELPADWYSWMPTAHHDHPKLFKYIDEFFNIKFEGLRSDYDSRLLYIWGHSYEFENNKNWERLTEICKKISGKDDIWYATNIEIYDYVNAFRSLNYSADGNIIHNPTLFEIWFTLDTEMYSIKPGETLNLK